MISNDIIPSAIDYLPLYQPNIDNVMNLRRFLKHQSKIFTLLITLNCLLHYSRYIFFFQSTNSDDINENCIISSLTEQVGTSGTSAQGATIHVPEESVREVEIEGAENQATREDDSNSVSAEKSTEHVCIVCLKKRKKHSGREQQLQSCITEDSLKNLQSIANEMGDEQLSNRITVMKSFFITKSAN
jgi:hypothetical protein